MPDPLSASVGLGGRNVPADVQLVQRRLDRHGFDPGRTPGSCDAALRASIITFQAGFMRDPDGRIDPGGVTWRRLSAEPGSHGAAPAGDSLTRLEPAPLRSAINGGLTPVSNAFMTTHLGAPRESYSADDQPLTNPRLRRCVSTESVGPFRATGLDPALASLREVLAEVARVRPEVHAALGTAGMLCCRYVRGSTRTISNHSWGTAVDLKINGVLDRRGDGMVQHGLTLIAPIFNRFGWYWGATFPTEDGMHFEASRSLIEHWSAQLGAH